MNLYFRAGERLIKAEVEDQDYGMASVQVYLLAAGEGVGITSPVFWSVPTGTKNEIQELTQ